jgi:hypothetical protein
MDVIRSNYSTLGPHAQREAPSTPEFPYTQIMAAYRGAIDAIDSPVDDLQYLGTRTEGSTIRNHTMAFQRILNQFFGDYFKEDADEELASDMADRWASFARGGDPNYEGSKGEWLPWMNEKGTGAFFQNYKTSMQSSLIEEAPEADEDRLFASDEADFDISIQENTEYEYEYEFIEDQVDEESYPNSLSWGEHIRTQALEALQMAVAENDMLKTELRRLPHESSDTDNAFLRGKMFFKGNNARKMSEHKSTPSMSKMEAKEAIHLAQEAGVLGSGLLSYGTEKLFFPELFELSWPPEGRLLERDCTCDMWDRIRCK